jgi:flagellar motor switch protein FliG
MSRLGKGQAKEDIRQLSGAERSAVLLLAIGEEHGARVWEMLDEDEVKEISQVMSNLGNISATLVERLMVDFVSQMSATGSLMGSYESTERLIAKFMPGDKVGQIMEEIRGPAGRTMWDKLANVNETVLANYLKNEYPQTVAVVLSKIKPVQRMLRMDSVQKDILDKVEKTLRVEFMSNLARTAKRDVYEHMAEIFNNFDRQTESRFLTALEERSRDNAERIKALMFTFEDLAKLDPGSIQTLLRSVEKDKLALALKGATDTLRDVFFSNMSERAGKILREDMEAMGPVRLKDVDDAQMRMVNVAKDLANKGEIMIANKQGEDELIY